MRKAIVQSLCLAITVTAASGCELFLIAEKIDDISDRCDPELPVGITWQDETAFAAGVEDVVTVCLDGDRRDYSIERVDVFAEVAVAVTGIEREDECVEIQIQTSEPGDYSVTVAADAEQERFGLCRNHSFEAELTVPIEVRDPDGVARFYPRFAATECLEEGPYPLLVGSTVSFDLRLAAGEDVLSYGNSSPPLLLDLGQLVEDGGSRFVVPSQEESFSVTSLLGDSFTREIIPYTVGQVDGLTIIANRDEIPAFSFNSIEVNATLGGVPVCDRLDEQVELVVETPELCEFSEGATTATVQIGRSLFVFGRDAVGECVVRATLQGATQTFAFDLT